MFVLTMAADGGVLLFPPPIAEPVERGSTTASTPPSKSIDLLSPVVRGAVRRRTPAPESYQLREATDGSGDLQYDEGGFSARVARDGSVTFKDKSVTLLNPLDVLLPKSGPRNVPSLFTTINSLARRRGVPSADENAQTEDRYLLIPNLTRYRPDPREGCRACVRPLDPLLINIYGRFDLTDELMRFNGQDPYRYQKAKFLAETRKWRVEMAAKTHSRNLSRALEELPAFLDKIACDGGRALPERRAIIERLRDELDGASAESHAAAETIARFLAARFRDSSPAEVVGCAVAPASPHRVP
jgi:hypothetical protein